ncbi:hypothetical protein FOZ62_017031 [Perkinsus olseni]|uniref:SET domain-containing protein n=1 Tax=Perkinsus olseni TaxID=32597 RepID=A0A7J6TA16_PEROL|nr:hypothetical protein FOZ62_017031 [Perkinsus olseni]
MSAFPVDIAEQMSQALEFLQTDRDDESLQVSLKLSSKGYSDSTIGKGGVRVSEGDQPGSYFLSGSIALENSDGEGFGWFARDDIPEGTLLLSELPLAHLYDEDMDAVRLMAQEETGMIETEATESELLTQVIIADAESRNDDYWISHLGELHPRGEDYDATDPEVIHQKCRLNILGFETCPEMTTYQQVFADLSGIGLYAKASGFNHSCSPNVNRFAIGTCQHFVTNRAINRGEQLTISYFEHEYLSSSLAVRRKQLESRDFICACSRCVDDEKESREAGHTEEEEGEREMTVLPEDLNDSLAVATASQRSRSEMCTELLNRSFRSADPQNRQVLGTKALIETLIWLAVSELQLQNYDKTDEAWAAAYNVITENMPPNDESLALCLMHRTAANLFERNYTMANRLARLLVRQHSFTFGLSYKLMRQRYSLEVAYLAQSTLGTAGGQNLDKRMNLVWTTVKRAWLLETRGKSVTTPAAELVQD